MPAEYGILDLGALLFCVQLRRAREHAWQDMASCEH
jgi:hypothetical protein